MSFGYATVVQNLRLTQVICLVLSALALYASADQIGLFAFLILFTIVCGHLYIVLLQWRDSRDGAYDFSGKRFILLICF